MLLLLGVPADLAAALRAELNLHGEEVPLAARSVEELMARLDARGVEGVVLGPDLPRPLEVAQRVHGVARALPVILLPSAADHGPLADAMRFTPFLGETVDALPPGPDAARRVHATLRRHRLRRRHRATLDAINAAPAPHVHGKAAQYLDRLLVHAPVGVLFVDRDGTVLAANPRARAILALEEAVRPLPLFPEVLDAADDAPLKALLSDETPAERPAVVERRMGAGGARHVEITLSHLRGDAGEPGAMVLLQDVSARVDAERELRATRRRLAEREKLSALGSLVAGVAHEIRTPLAYLINNVSLLGVRLRKPREAPVDPAALLAEVQPFLDAAEEGVERIDRLVRDLRRFTKLKPGDVRVTPLEPVVADAAELFRAAGRTRVTLVEDLRPTPPVRVDTLHVQQVVINLLDNAADAGAPGAPVLVATRTVEGAAELSVTDRGSGIPPDIQPRIFDPLFSTKHEGTGLGLPIVKELVAAHGGTIRFTTTPGEGTTFIVRFPAAAPDSL